MIKDKPHSDVPLWIVSQLGAREHYAVARALHLQRKLQALVTETWTMPGSIRRLVSSRLADRYHPDIPSNIVQSFNSSTLWFELAAKVRGHSEWSLMLERNLWFQHRAAKEIAKLRVDAGSPPTLFAYSYAALELFKLAKSFGWKTVLGQIDGGVEEERRIEGIRASLSRPLQASNLPLSTYWLRWRRECELADHIVVNSNWSFSLLENAGIPKYKMSVIPLTYKSSLKSLKKKRNYPKSFDSKRPFRVLFLGQIGIRKGILELLSAAQLLCRQPIEFWIVGPEVDSCITMPIAKGKVKYFGAVPRSETYRFYADADVFLFPTHSDGFGLTQLEAMDHGLPIIASKYCGEVVSDGINGHLLENCTAQAIKNILMLLLENPQILSVWAENCFITDEFSIESVGRRFLSLCAAKEDAFLLKSMRSRL